MNWKKATLAFVDTETTGLNPDSDRVIEVGVLVVKDLEPVGSFESLIDPERPLPPEIVTVTGITDADLEDKPIFADVAFYLRRHFRMADALVIYNAPFDLGFLYQEFQREAESTGRHAPSLPPSLDPLVWVRHVDRFVKGKGRHKLGVTASRYGVEVKYEGQAHRALYDCHLTLGVVRHLAAKLPDDLEVLFDRQEDRRAQQERAFKAYKDKKAGVSRSA